MKAHIRSGILLFLFLAFIKSVYACTDFRVTAKDGTVFIARSMEYALDLQSSLRTSNRNRTITTTAPSGKPGLSWTTKYGYVFLDAFHVDTAIDGMNEKGLSYEALYLPNLAEYQTVPENHEKEALSYLNFGDWILGNFSSVDEVKSALKNVYVYTQKIPGQGDLVFPLHFSIYDSTGKGLVVEYIAGQLHTYENKVGVLTNSPSYDWQLANLNNHVNLSPFNPAAIDDNGIRISPLGQGFGMVGIPGDITPPSRFVKIATLSRVAVPANDATNALNLASHIINTVDIPRGFVREQMKNGVVLETAQWVVFKDLTHKVIYYRTYDNPELRAVSLDKIDFSENVPRLSMPLADKQVIEDVTDQFLKSQAK